MIAAPGNAGYSGIERWEFSGKKEDFLKLAQKAKLERIDLAVIGPDGFLANGIVDVFQSQGIPCFGPSQAAAQIEASKSFAKEVMKAAGVPTAEFTVVYSLDEAEKFLKQAAWGFQSSGQSNGQTSGWVIKADGLALGKGVQVCHSLEDALIAAKNLIEISGKLVIEECVSGEELSWMAFCDGNLCALLDPARDYKTLLEDGKGPNTGGMGAYSPVSGLPKDLSEKVLSQIFYPTLGEMRKRGIPFRGLLYAGLMYNSVRNTFWVLEFNSRFGDPETQVLLPRMSDDLFDWCMACAKGDLSQFPKKVGFSGDCAVVVVGAAKGYPENPEKGAKLPSLLNAPECFLAGVRENERHEWVTSGGRVLGALGIGKNFEIARVQAYERLKQMSFPGMQFREDIALDHSGSVLS